MREVLLSYLIIGLTVWIVYRLFTLIKHIVEWKDKKRGDLE